MLACVLFHYVFYAYVHPLFYFVCLLHGGAVVCVLTKLGGFCGSIFSEGGTVTNSLLGGEQHTDTTNILSPIFEDKVLKKY